MNWGVSKLNEFEEGTEGGEPSFEDFLIDETDDEVNKKRKKRSERVRKGIAFVLVAVMMANLLAIWPKVFNLPAMEFIKTSIELSQNDYIQEYKQAVVAVQGDNVKGTGFNISSDGYVVTNYHVIKDIQNILISFPNGEIFKGEVVRGFPDVDIAFLNIKGTNLPYLELNQTFDWKENDQVFVIGNPLAYFQIVNEGQVIGVTTISDVKSEVMTISTPIYKGNSGSPVIDNNGKVIGVVFAKTIPKLKGTSESMGLVIPIPEVLKRIPK